MSVFVQYLGQASQRPNITFLHGWGMHHKIWGVLPQELFALGFNVTLIDLPGHGNSEALVDYSIDAQVTAIVKVLPVKSIIVGWSLGGLIALQIANNYPERVQRVCMLSSTPQFIGNDSWKYGIKKQLLDIFSTSLLQDVVQTLRRFNALIVQGSVSVREDLRVLRSRFALLDHADIASLEAGLDILYQSKIHQINIQRPIDWIIGENDPLIPYQGIVQLAKQYQQHYFLLRSANHVPFIARQKKIIAIMKKLYL